MLKQTDHFKFSLLRKKCIFIEDSYMKYMGFFDKKSFYVTPRNPFKLDSTAIDYDMSSEEEWNE